MRLSECDVLYLRSQLARKIGWSDSVILQEKDLLAVNIMLEVPFEAVYEVVATVKEKAAEIKINDHITF